MATAGQQGTDLAGFDLEAEDMSVGGKGFQVRQRLSRQNRQILKAGPDRAVKISAGHHIKSLFP